MVVFFSRTRHDSVDDISDDEHSRILVEYADILRDMQSWYPQEKVLRTFPNYAEKEYHLTRLQRLFLFINNPMSSKTSKYFERFMGILVFASICSLAASTVPEMNYVPSHCSKPACSHDPTFCPTYEICAPVSFVSYLYFELACTVIFTIDFFMKISLVSLMPTRFVSAEVVFL